MIYLTPLWSIKIAIGMQRLGVDQSGVNGGRSLKTDKVLGVVFGADLEKQKETMFIISLVNRML
jgi:hypothetical protein